MKQLIVICLLAIAAMATHAAISPALYSSPSREVTAMSVVLADGRPIVYVITANGDLYKRELQARYGGLGFSFADTSLQVVGNYWLRGAVEHKTTNR